ncbi:MAG TPA: 50S ribosomal protein L24 [Patescibacteria group bacterium]|nr:50S ribosomal protein L24 [Patescibacteria group bacterium]
MKIKKGDTVKVLSGKYKGKTGKVIAAFPKTGKVVVENVNLHTRFERAKQSGKQGTKVTLPSPFDVSKVMLVDPASGNQTRVGYQIMDNGKKQRIAKASGKAV